MSAAIRRREAQAIRARCKRDLTFQIERVQGVRTLEGYQKRIIGKVSDALNGKSRRRIAVSACHDVGKTWTMAKIALAIGATFRGAKIITTAPTMTLVELLLWSEIRTGHRLSKYPLGGRMLNTEWKIEDDWFAIGLSPKEDAGGGDGQGAGSSFQGVHGELVVVLFDEATGVPPKRWLQAEGMMTSANVLFIAIGNPTSRNSPFFKCFSSGAWEKIHLSCFDSPNLIANGITDMDALLEELATLQELDEDAQFKRISGYKVVQGKLLTLQWVMEKALEWGVDHPLFVSKVLGRFPEEDDHFMMSLGVIEAAQRRDYLPSDNDRWGIGVDVARSGKDKTVIIVMHGPKVVKRIVLAKRFKTDKVRNTAVAGEIINLLRGIPSRNVVVAIDGTGIGAGVIDVLEDGRKELGIHQGVEIREVIFAEGFDDDRDTQLYANMKAKIFVRLAKDLEQNLCLPEDSVYLEELPTILFDFDKKGRHIMEEKKAYKKRTGRGSPDTADALAMANDARYDAPGVGTFSETFVEPAETASLAPGLNSGVIW